MSPISSWAFLLLLCVNSMVCSKECTWFQSKGPLDKTLANLRDMIPKNKTDDCDPNIELPKIHWLYRMVESAAEVVLELVRQTSQIYSDHEKLVTNQTAWEKLREDLYEQEKMLEDCISRSTEDQRSLRISRNMSLYFTKMKDIIGKQDTACAQTIIHNEIKYNFLQAERLSGHVRKTMRKYPKKTAV